MKTIARIEGAVLDRSARGIAHGVAGLIESGAIPVGQRMPTVRELAKSLSVSPGSISDAWRFLVEDGMLETRGRLGTFVLDFSAVAPWRQFRGVVGTNLPIDLSTGFPDPELLIDLRPYLAELADAAPYTGYPAHELDPELARALAPVLPFQPNGENTVLATHVIGALTELLPAIGGVGTGVIVVDPEFAPYLDLLERFKMQPMPVGVDDEGMRPDDVEAAVAAGARAAILQTRVHNPTGVSTSRRRLEQLSRLFARNDVWILDGDFYGELIPDDPLLSAAEWAPAHTVYIRAFSKDIHPDIRVAVMIGAPRLMRAVHRRRVGGFEVSRINQDLLRLLIEDPQRRRQTETMSAEFARRQTVFLRVMTENGIVVRPSRGFNVWVPVRSEPDALVYLAAQGIGVAPGSAFKVRDQSPHIRVSTAALAGDAAAISAQIATAAKVSRTKG